MVRGAGLGRSVRVAGCFLLGMAAGGSVFCIVGWHLTLPAALILEADRAAGQVSISSYAIEGGLNMDG